MLLLSKGGAEGQQLAQQVLAYSNYSKLHVILSFVPVLMVGIAARVGMSSALLFLGSRREIIRAHV